MLEKMQSDQINELAMALSKVQGEMTPAIKDSSNPFFKSKYADLSSVWNCCKDTLSKNGLAVIQTMDWKDGQNLLITTLAHASGQWMRSCAPLLNDKNNVQGLGSAITYMRRYALSAIIGIVCEEDDDGNAALPKVSKSQVESLLTLLDQCDDVYVAQVQKNCEQAGIKNWDSLTVDQYKKIYDAANNKLKRKSA